MFAGRNPKAVPEQASQLGVNDLRPDLRRPQQLDLVAAVSLLILT